METNNESFDDIHRADKIRIDYSKVWAATDTKPKQLVHIPMSIIKPIFDKIIAEDMR